MTREEKLARLNALIAKGEKIVKSMPPHVDTSWHRFSEELPPDEPAPTGISSWRAAALSFLQAELGGDHTYTEHFRSYSEFGTRDLTCDAVDILKAVRDDPACFPTESPIELAESSTIDKLSRIADRFHSIVRELQYVHKTATTQPLTIGNEYDVQYLLHKLLMLYFDDIRPEEWMPNYAGSSSRVDFLLKKERVLVETKMMRDSLNQKSLRGELIIDIAQYKNSPDCDTIFCLVYDPIPLLRNAPAIMNDLSRTTDGKEVIVLIRP